MTTSDIGTHITGAVNEYYSTATEAEAGELPVWCDEVYARRCPNDATKWDVRRLTVRPVMPKGTRLPGDLQMLFLIAAAQMSLPQNEMVTIAHRVDLKTAFDMVRAHEVSPPLPVGKTAASYVLKQVCAPEDSSTHWAQLQI